MTLKQDFYKRIPRTCVNTLILLSYIGSIILNKLSDRIGAGGSLNAIHLQCF